MMNGYDVGVYWKKMKRVSVPGGGCDCGGGNGSADGGGGEWTWWWSLVVGAGWW